MNKITYVQLKALRACEGQLQLFKDTFGEEVTFNSLEEAESLSLKYAQVFDFYFLGVKFFGESYQEAKAPLWKAYEEAKASLYKTYEEATVPLYKTYKEAKAPLLKAYEEAGAPLWEAYLEAQAKLVAKMIWEF